MSRLTVFIWTTDDKAEHAGGLTIFGKTFGNYGQDIKVSINYAPMHPDEP